VVDTSGKNEQVILLQPYAHPLVILAPDIKVSLTPSNIANLLIFVQVLVEEHLDLVLVHITHLLGRDDDLVAVLVSSVGGQLVDAVDVGEVVVEHAQLAQLIRVESAAGIVRETLVALGSEDVAISGVPTWRGSVARTRLLTGRLSYM
jgi:hypothetical protein